MLIASCSEDGEFLHWMKSRVKVTALGCMGVELLVVDGNGVKSGRDDVGLMDLR